MAMNRIQFQTSPSMPEFFKRCGTASQREAALGKACWLEAFRCPRCDSAAHCIVWGGALQCSACRHQTPPIARTIFQGTKLGLVVLFLALYLIG
jgi:hypothetical protein